MNFVQAVVRNINVKENINTKNIITGTSSFLLFVSSFTCFFFFFFFWNGFEVVYGDQETSIGN